MTLDTNTKPLTHPGHLGLATGLRNVLDLSAEEVNVWDWAWGLHHINRWSGATCVPWDVLSHTGLVFELAIRDVGATLNPLDKIGLLLHDAGEAYVLDMPRPLKHMEGMEAFRNAEADIMDVILDRMGIRTDTINWELIKRYDDQALWLEWQKFFHYYGPEIQKSYAPPSIYPLDPNIIEFKKARPFDYALALRDLLLGLQGTIDTPDLDGLFMMPKHLEPYILGAPQVEAKESANVQMTAMPGLISPSDILNARVD